MMIVSKDQDNNNQKDNDVNDEYNDDQISSNFSIKIIQQRHA